ncbi:metallophosphoesterase family protein [Dyella nitratireducens]|uniref:Metallophosphoesterase n=1 Tax=Dyella nitratireducens TaxID=1849580 RepID=A0ABQ1G4K0_9GAMM|nr:metallophosphoesterase [Dyella nitratireducens]GGA36447.1 metallophosphoesterase [Dyella nitratireducens]GLQ41069.1 metallophosphoesterase [Dyella nitratireducens]
MDTDDSRADGRRQFLKCMAWAGAGTLWLMKSGVLHAQPLGQSGTGQSVISKDATFSFVQISDSHIGFHKAPNPDVVGTLRRSLAMINAQSTRPAFLLHTGDLTHLSKPEEFDTLAGVMQEARVGRSFYVPGEHDVIGDNGAEFFRRFGEKQQDGGWYSFDQDGVHFVGLINVLNLKAGGLGSLGTDQLAWLKKDLAGLSAETPIVVFAHMPLWPLYPQWGWGTDDSAEALGYLKRFGSVTVLNGHIHQIQQKVEGSITFYTARSTAYPQPAPGEAPAPGPLQSVKPDALHRYLGIRDVRHVRVGGALAVTDEVLT